MDDHTAGSGVTAPGVTGADAIRSDDRRSPTHRARRVASLHLSRNLMSAYSIALFFHLLGVLALFAGIGLEQTGLRQLRNAPSLAQVREWMTLLRGLRRLDAPAGLI